MALVVWSAPVAFSSRASANEPAAPVAVEASPSPGVAANPRAPAVPALAAEATPEPTLAEAQSAAARLAAGTRDEDSSRLSRARAAHWAPVLRGQAGRADTEATRSGTQSQAPLHWDQQGGATTWAVAATWDLGQLVYDRDENALALSRTLLARRRQEVAEECARLYAERFQKMLASRDARGAVRLEAALELLRATASLDALTGGLFREALGSTQAAVDQLTEPLRAAARPAPLSAPRAAAHSPSNSAPHSEEER